MVELAVPRGVLAAQLGQVGAPWLEAVNVGDVIDSVCLSVGGGELKEPLLAERAGLRLRVPVSSLQSREDA